MSRILQSDLSDIFLRTMNKLGDDIYCSGIPDKDNSYSPLVLVHPYYRRFMWKNEGIPTFNKYNYSVEDLIRTNQGPLVIFEDQTAILQTLPIFFRLSEGKPFYVVTTCWDEPTPIHGWSAVLTFLQQLKGRPLRVAGGIISADIEAMRMRGCLANTIEQLYEANIPVEIIERATFS